MKQWNKIYKKNPKKYKYYNLLECHADLPMVSEFFKSKGVKKVLDLGCGSGRNFFYLNKEGFKVYGIDIAENGILQIKKNIPNAKAIVGDVFSKLPYPDNHFDAIVSIQVLQHSTEEKIKKSIDEVFRILRPEGFIFITLCGRYSKGKIRYCLVKTAKKIAKNTYIPTIGDETGMIHFIYNKKTLLNHYRKFDLIDFWKDEKDYYCFLGKKLKFD